MDTECLDLINPLVDLYFNSVIRRRSFTVGGRSLGCVCV